MTIIEYALKNLPKYRSEVEKNLKEIENTISDLEHSLYMAKEKKELLDVQLYIFNKISRNGMIKGIEIPTKQFYDLLSIEDYEDYISVYVQSNPEYKLLIFEVLKKGRTKNDYQTELLDRVEKYKDIVETLMDMLIHAPSQKEEVPNKTTDDTYSN